MYVSVCAYISTDIPFLLPLPAPWRATQYSIVKEQPRGGWPMRITVPHVRIASMRRSHLPWLSTGAISERNWLCYKVGNQVLGS